MTKLENIRKIEKFENRIFQSVPDLKKELKNKFKVDCGIELIKNKGFDDELCFFAEGFCFSLYIMRGSSGRIIVVETSVLNNESEV